MWIQKDGPAELQTIERLLLRHPPILRDIAAKDVWQFFQDKPSEPSIFCATYDTVANCHFPALRVKITDLTGTKF